jgi:hypothetical protein
MQLPVGMPAIHPVATAAILAAVFIACVVDARRSSAQMTVGIAEDNATVGQQAGVLAPIVQRILAEALFREREIKRRGARRVTSPYAFPLCLAEHRPCEVPFPLPLCLFEQGLCGAVNRDGSIAVAPRFDFVDEFHEGRALVRSGGLYGYVDLNDKVVVEPRYAIAGRYHLGYAEVDIDGKSALIDLEGRQVLPPRFARAGAFTKNVFWVNEGVRDYRGPLGSAMFAALEVDSGSTDIVFVRGKWGLIDAAGAWIREPEFSAIAIFDLKSGVMWAKAEGGWGLINPNGSWFLEPTFQSIIGASEGNGRLLDDRAPVMLGRRAGFIDHTGQIAIAPKFDYAQHFVAGMPARVTVGRGEGLIDRSGGWLVEPSYEYISPISRGASGRELDSEFKGFLARRGESYDILDQSGKTIISGLTIDHRLGYPRTSSTEAATFPLFCPDGRIIGVVDKKPRMFGRDGAPILPTEGELWWPLSCEAPYAFKIGGRFGYLDDNLRPLIEAKFETVGLFVGGVAIVKLDGKFGLIRADGTWAIRPSFDVAQVLPGQLALVKIGAEAAVIDVSTARLVTQTTFDDVCSLGRGVIGVVQNGTMGTIDQSGSWLLQPKYQPWFFGFFQDFTPVQSNGKWGFADAAGNAIEAKFDEVRRFERGLAWAKSGTTWCPIDRHGNAVSPLPCQSADPNPTQRPRPEHTIACQIRP